MLLQALLIGILLNDVKAIKIDSLVVMEFTERLPSDFLIARQTSNDSAIENFAVVDFEQSNESSRELRAQLHNIYQVAALDKPCTLDESVRHDAANATVTTFERLKNDKVVLVWYDESGANEDRRTRIVVMHLESCLVINRDMSDLRDNPIVVTTDNGDFDVFLDDEVACNSARCVISYHLELDEYDKPKPFDVDLDWPNLQIDRLASGDYVVRGFKDSVYKVLLMNRTTGQSKVLMSILAVNPKLEFLSSGLSFCWTIPSVDTSMRCAQFNDQGELIFSSKVIFKSGTKVTLIHVHDIGEGQVGLIFGEIGCADCWDLNVARIDRDRRVSFEQAKFQCTGDRKKLAIFGFAPKDDSSTNVQYACRHKNGYAYDRNCVTMRISDSDSSGLLPACQTYEGDKQLFCT